jgi:hypothetical protein
MLPNWNSPLLNSYCKYHVAQSWVGHKRTKRCMWLVKKSSSEANHTNAVICLPGPEAELECIPAR